MNSYIRTFIIAIFSFFLLMLIPAWIWGKNAGLGGIIIVFPIIAIFGFSIMAGLSSYGKKYINPQEGTSQNREKFPTLYIIVLAFIAAFAYLFIGTMMSR